MFNNLFVRNVSTIEGTRIRRRQLLVDAALDVRPVISIDYFREGSTEQKHSPNDILIGFEYRPVSRRPNGDMPQNYTLFTVKTLQDGEFKMASADIYKNVMSNLSPEYMAWLKDKTHSNVKLPAGMGWDGIWPLSAYQRYYKAIGFLTGTPVKWAEALANECRMYSNLDFNKRKPLSKFITLDEPAEILIRSLTGDVTISALREGGFVLPNYTYRAAIIRRGIKHLHDGTRFGVSWELFEN